MGKYRSLLLATDLSGRSDRPTSRALDLTSQMDARLVVLHVPASRSLAANEEAKLENRIRSDFGLQDAEILLRYGSVPSVIADVAAERRSDLIITGVARFNSPRDFVLGTAVDTLVRRSPVPVLVVKRRAHGPYERLLVATDFSDCSVQAFLVAADLFPRAALRLINACHPGYEGFLDRISTVEFNEAERTNEMDALLGTLPAEVRVRTDAVVSAGDFNDAIDEQVREFKADLLVIGSHGASGFLHSRIGSKAASLLSHATVDTLIVREHRHGT